MCAAKHLAHRAQIETLRKRINCAWFIMILFWKERGGKGSSKIEKREENRAMVQTASEQRT